MSCVLRASGPDFSVDSFLRESTLQPCSVYRRGEPRYPLTQPAGAKNTVSGLNVQTSDADFCELGSQIADTIRYLEQNHAELARLVSYPGVESVSVDFGIEERSVAAQSESFPPKLLAIAGNLGIWLQFTMYPADEVPQIRPTNGSEL